jgi:transcriptional regulator with XRE-family HTH domain
MITPLVIREARKRAGLSQAELAERLGRPQSSVGRWETGRRTPSLEVVREVARACGLDLTYGLARADDSYDWLIDQQLALSPSERLARMHSGTGDPISVLDVLQAATVDFVLVGEVAAALRGCPISLDRNVVSVVPRRGLDDVLTGSLRSIGAVTLAVVDEFTGVHAVEPWVLADGATLEVVQVPAGTHGFDDLRRDAEPLAAGGSARPLVASAADLARIADASPRPVDRAWRTALRTLAERTA